MKLFDVTNKKGILKYIIFGICEIVLLIIGILLAVQIDARITKGKDDKTRCQYLEELLFVFEEDIFDVQGNIEAFEGWNPSIYEIGKALSQNQLSTVDSLYDKLGLVGNYIHFGQGSKSKIEELKYSQINLIEDRKLKNKILKYQNVLISFLRDRENRYDKVGEDLRDYYTNNFNGFNYEKVKPNDINKLIKDDKYFSLIRQRYKWNEWFRNYYGIILKEQIEIKEMIQASIDENCM